MVPYRSLMAVINCRTDDDFRTGLESLRRETGPCRCIERPRALQIGLERGSTTLLVKLTDVPKIPSIRAFFGDMYKTSVDRQVAARWFEHGHGADGTASCDLCIASSVIES